MTYLFEIGGDYFEYRPLDFYWPLLAVPVAEGVVQLAARISDALQRIPRYPRWVGSRSVAITLFVPTLFFSSALQAALFLEGNPAFKRHGEDFAHISLHERNAKWLLSAPAMPVLVAVSDDLRRLTRENATGLRTFYHNVYFSMQKWIPYENLERGLIPRDAVTALAGIGVVPYYLSDLIVIDKLGLADATIARNPVTRPARLMAHERQPPVGYLQRRGVNIRIHSPAASEAEALARANYALHVSPGLWMPFNALDHAWASERFATRDLRAVNRFSQTDPAGNRLQIDGVHYVGERFLGRFEDGLDGWSLDGKAVSNNKDLVHYKPGEPVFGHVGPGFLTTYWPGKWEKSGSVFSPKFVVENDQYLVFLLAGYSGGDVEFRLIADGREVADWSGENTEAFEVVVFSLTNVAGRELQLEVFNGEIGTDARLMLDHVMLMREDTKS